MGKRIVVDPITRIEGHLRIEVEISGGKVINAWTSGQMFRGIEMMLKGRDPRDAHHFVQRSCGVCTYIHGLASVKAVEDAVNVQIPDNARIIRNLLHGAQYQHDHIVHFYHLHALDWVDVVSAVRDADPAKTAKLSDNVSNAPWGGTTYFKNIQQRLKTFIDSGQLGPLNNAYWGHKAYQMPPEANLMAAAHYIEALRIQARAARMHAIFGAKNPHPQSLVCGGITSIQDITPDRIAEFQYIWKETKEFVENVYIPDLLAVASFYKNWGGIGGNTDNFLSWGEFDSNGGKKEFPEGLIINNDLNAIKNAEPAKVTEDVTRAWYEKDSKARHPLEGKTEPKYTKYDTKSRQGKYSWLKAPRYDGMAVEVGPLARILIAYGKGHKEITELVGGVTNKLGIPATALFSTLGRTAARGLETVVIGNAMEGWINELVENVKKGDIKTYKPWTMPDKGSGSGFCDVPRGALGHWIDIEGGKIKNYQYVVPSTWNFGPRDEKGEKGPVEKALIGTPIEDPKRPLEILRTVHSFDPCIACAVHVIDPDSNELYKIRVT